MWSKVKAWLASHGVTEYELRDAGVRALKTAVQAFIAVAPVSAVFEGDWALIIAGLSAAGSALVAFCWNVLLDWTRGEVEYVEDDYSA